MLKKAWTSAKRRWFPYFIARTAKIGVRLLLCTCRIQVNGLDRFIATAKESPCILMLWHNRLVIISEVVNRYVPQFIYTAFISKSRDGDPLASLAQSYQFGRVLRVPHNLRHSALSQMISLLKDKREIVVITPDGPRGPRYIVKPGIALAAREAKAKIIPFSWKANKAWTLNTWDKMLIPKPFSKIHVTFGESIDLNPENTLEKEIDLIQSTLLNMV